MELARLSARNARARNAGQASVELLAAIPALLLIAALVWELALAGQSAWLCANAARAAARARVVGRDARAAARGAPAPPMRRGGGGAQRPRGAVPGRARRPVL